MYKNIIYLFISFGFIFLFGCSSDFNEVKGMTKPELSFPQNNSFALDKTSVELKWKNSNSVGLTGPIVYKIYLDTNPNPTTYKGKSNIPSFTANNLNNNTVYFWKIESVADGVTESSDEVFSFTTIKTIDLEKAALISLYDALAGDSWTNKTNWKSDKQVSEWFGVTVNSDGFITKLKLSSNNLSGTIPDQITNLKHLKVLDLSNNNFNTAVPKSIGNIATLDSLALTNSNFQDFIPVELSKLAALRYLLLQQNNFIGPIPKKFGELKELQYFLFFDNDLSGIIPKEIGNLRKLRHIAGQDNVLTGSIPPALANINTLSIFVFSNNRLSGELPDFSNTSMSYFFVENNAELTGDMQKSGLCGSSVDYRQVRGTQITPCPGD